MTSIATLTKFIELHYEKLLGFARKAAYQDEEDASEAVYRCLIKAPDRRLVELQDATKIPGWLWEIVEWRVLDVRRKRLKLDKSGTVGMQTMPPEDVAELHDSQPRGTDDGGTAEHPVFVAVEGCWSVLSETEQSILELRLLRDPPTTLEEAAALLGLSYDTIKSRSYTGLSKLRQCLDQKGISEPRHLFEP